MTKITSNTVSSMIVITNTAKATRKTRIIAANVINPKTMMAAKAFTPKHAMAGIAMMKVITITTLKMMKMTAITTIPTTAMTMSTTKSPIVQIKPTAQKKTLSNSHIRIPMPKSHINTHHSLHHSTCIRT
jgi:hypothetical protein